MNKFLIAALLLFVTNLLYGQVVTSTIPFPTENDSITIIFDATRGNQGLMGYTGDVYVHTGLITDKSTTPTDWKYVIGSWGNNNNQPILTRIATDTYELVIGLPRDFYPIVDVTEKILKLAFVFRSENSGLAGRDVGGADIFLDLFETGMTLFFIEPTSVQLFSDPLRSPVFAGIEDTVKLIASAVALETEVDSLLLYVSGVLVAADTLDTLTYDLVTSDFGVGPIQLEIVGVDSAGVRASSSLSLMINPPIVNSAPPEGTIPGINYNSATSVTLALFAPKKEFVYVISDFNDWFVDTSFFMNKHEVSEDSVLWWLTINGVTPTIEYAFQYLVDGDLRIADPYTDKTLDPGNDLFIPQVTYPDLKDYPAGKTTNITSLFETNQQPFNWLYSDTFVRAKQEDLVIYELLVRDFTARHDYETLKDTLDYLDSLGINAIELMPFNEFEGNSSWGYNPSFYFAPDKYYGTKDALKSFIDECHRRGIAVLLDKVLNHSYSQSPIVQLYWNKQMNRPSADNPWYNEESNFVNPDAHWGYDFNHESVHTQAFVDRVNSYWMTEYKIDGFRFDFTKGFGNNIKPLSDLWGSIYDTDRIRLLKRMADSIWNTDSTAYVIFEHLAENSEEQELAEYRNGIMLWGNMNYNYSQASMGYNSSNESNFAWGYYGNRGWNKASVVTYMESHDEERMMYRNMNFGWQNGDYDIKDFATALERLKMTAAFFLTYPGPKMIWQFGEVGYDISIDDPCRVCEKPIRWGYFHNEDRRKLYKTYQALLNLRTDYEVFRSPDTDVTMSVTFVVKRIYLSHPSMDVAIIGNFSLVDREFNPRLQRTGWWYDYFTGDSIFVEDVTDSMIYYPGEFHILTTEKLSTPEQGIIIGVKSDLSERLPIAIKLSQNYPNPFNPATKIEFSLPKKTETSLIIYNVLGQEVKRLLDGSLSAGDYEIYWDASGYSSGVYLYELRTEKYRFVRKMLLLK